MARKRRRRRSEERLGPQATAIVHDVLGQLATLQPCEHLADGSSDEAMWIASKPGNLLCLEFCWGAEQVLVSQYPCTACGQPAGPDSDGSVIIFKRDSTLALHFWLCSSCDSSGAVPGR